MFCEQNRAVNAQQIAVIVARQAGDGRLDEAAVVGAVAIPEIAQPQRGPISRRAVPPDLSQIGLVDERAGAAAGRQLHFEDNVAVVGIPAFGSIADHDGDPDAFRARFAHAMPIL